MESKKGRPSIRFEKGRAGRERESTLTWGKRRLGGAPLGPHEAVVVEAVEVEDGVRSVERLEYSPRAVAHPKISTLLKIVLGTRNQ